MFLKYATKQINQLQKEFVDELQYGKDPSIELQNAYIEMERGLVPSDLLAVTTVLKKDPEAYSKNAYQRVVGNQIGAREGVSLLGLVPSRNSSRFDI